MGLEYAPSSQFHKFFKYSFLTAIQRSFIRRAVTRTLGNICCYYLMSCMFSVWTVSAILIGYLVLLFAMAFWRNHSAKDGVQHPIVYSLAMGVHCTSWAFFGTTTQAANYGWAVIPTYLGVILVMLFGYQAVLKIARICHQHRVSSLADFIGLQYQRSHFLAAVISLLCFFGVVPYIALQLDSVSQSIDIISRDGEKLSGNIGLYVTVVLAIFAVLFGTRSYGLNEKHPGLMLTIAFASLVKLFALVIVGVFVSYFLFDGILDLIGQAQLNDHARSIIEAPSAVWVYLSHILLGICAMFCLPRQFHVNFVENNGEQELRAARWMFPSYLVGMTLFVLPIALAGHVLLPIGSVSTDTYALALPVAMDQKGITVVSFIGGLAAATSMVMVATLAVGIMISNNLVTPLWLKIRLTGRPHSDLHPATLLFIRRLTIALVLSIAYFYHRFVSHDAPLANSGIISMALLAQSIPLMLTSLVWKRASKHTAFISLCIGAVGWFYWLLWPSIKSSYYFDPAPTDLALGLGFVMSLAANWLCFLILAWCFPAKTYSTADTEIPLQPPMAVRVSRLMALAEKMLQGEPLEEIRNKLDSSSDGYANPKLLERVETEIAAHIGAASARILISAIAEKEHVPLPDLVEWMEEASQTFQFNHEMLQSSVQHIQQGISVVDRDLNLIAWNQSYVELFDYPPSLIRAGVPMVELLAFNADRGLLGNVNDPQHEIDKRIAYIKQGSRYKYVRTQPNGRVIELNGSPLPGGGFVTTYSDITEYITIQKELEMAKSGLEKRVEQRTEELKQSNQALSIAKQQAEEANESKSKFLAAAGHDLMQPFNAASLFAELIAQKSQQQEIRQLSSSLKDSLSNAEELLSLLLDMTKLESGTLVAKLDAFRLDEVLSSLVSEFSIIAQEKGIELHYVANSLSVLSDKKLLRRVAQNLLSNAVRYTQSGKILIGAKRQGDKVTLLVADTGEGIHPTDQKRIFDEFQQLNRHGNRQGLGLGLTIVDRICSLLGHPISLHSEKGKGSIFAISMPRTTTRPEMKRVTKPAQTDEPILLGKNILLAENEVQTREAVSQLLVSWGASVVHIGSTSEVERLTTNVDLMLLDYHLDNQQKGPQIAQAVRQKLGVSIPGIINSASREESIRKEASDHDLHYLPKPLKLAAFKRLLRQMGLAR